jgi:hypothetical protein
MLHLQIVLVWTALVPFRFSIEANSLAGLKQYSAVCLAALDSCRVLSQQTCFSVSTLGPFIGLVKARQVKLGVFVHQEGHTG